MDINEKDVFLEKPKNDYWEETFSWGKKFAKERKIKSKDIIKAIDQIKISK